MTAGQLPGSQLASSLAVPMERPLDLLFPGSGVETGLEI